MKKMHLFLVLAMATASVAQARAVYEWKDDQGVVHMTDNPESVPQKYEKRVRERQINMKPSLPPVSTGGAATGGAVSAPAPAVPQMYGEHTREWWRDQFDSLRGQLEAVQAGLGGKQARLDQLQRERLLFQRARDRVAATELQAEIERDQTRIRELQTALASLATEASRSGVPAEWR